MRKGTCHVLGLILVMASHLWAQTEEVDYYALFFNGNRCGYASQTRQVQGQKVTTTADLHLEINRMGIPIKMSVTETSVETLAGKPLAFQTTQDMAMMRMSIDGTIRPDGTMELVTTNAGNSQKSESIFPQGALMAEGLRLLTQRKGLEPGTTYTARVFTASAMQGLDTTIVVGERQRVDLLGRVVELIEVTSTLSVPGAGRLTQTSFVDQEGVPQKVILPIAGIQVEQVACSEIFAKSNLEPAEVFNDMMLKSPRALVNLDRLKAVTYTLKPNQPDIQLVIPSTDNQQVQALEDGRVQVEVRPVSGNQQAGFPYQGDDPEVRAALASTAFLQSTHPDIVLLAQRAVAGKSTALEAACAIESFVADYIDSKDLSVGYASALEVMQSRQGDCTEHAVLCAALCRAVGIPAQVVMGVAYVDEFMGATRSFGGHAWAQAYIGNQWVCLDAAFKGSGRGGYDPGHIALAVGNGEPGDFFSLIGSIGQFTIESVKIER